MDYIIKQRLNSIEQMARQILRDVEGIYGYCAGMESVANELPKQEDNTPTAQTNGLIANKKN